MDEERTFPDAGGTVCVGRAHVEGPGSHVEGPSAIGLEATCTIMLILQ
jgi:hypothetical protein